MESDPLITRSFQELYPDRFAGQYTFTLSYSGKFTDYNANVKYRSNHYTFNLSRKWYPIDDDIKVGLIQSLFNKIFKTKKSTTNIDLYNLFIRRLARVITKTKADPDLVASFNRVNEQYMNALIERPNLVWGTDSFRTLGHYRYTTDTITISTILKEDLELLDYVMYHEMLHKKFQFESKNGRSFHHTPEFKRAEQRFHNASLLEQRLSRLASRHRRFSWLGF